ncbi:hypothetical protein [Pseudomonas phage LUZ7]|uniref:Uncharacterized protein n=1 Tax=Pseudomonas phage LUZ7 TaxID=655097 RepID=C8ZKB4_9CAUD|nr:hypothetical protein PP-LUZ7_gp015 [Pseudomonas phage LUZ7]CAZ66156.1 hypothetical protein [Pseudomonas phage LUZ7]
MKHPKPMYINSKASRERNADSVAAAMALLQQGTDHLPRTEVAAVSDAVGAGLCSIGSGLSHLCGTKSGNTRASRI